MVADMSRRFGTATLGHQKLDCLKQCCSPQVQGSEDEADFSELGNGMRLTLAHGAPECRDRAGCCRWRVPNGGVVMLPSCLPCSSSQLRVPKSSRAGKESSKSTQCSRVAIDL